MVDQQNRALVGHVFDAAGNLGTYSREAERRGGKSVATLRNLGFAAAAVTLGYLAYRRWFRKDPPTIVFNPNRGESRVDGSDEGPRIEPKCQLKLGFASKTGTIEVVGCGARVEFGGRDYIMTASHNIATGEPIYLIGKGSSIAVETAANVINCGYDTALIPITQATASKLGVTVAKFAAMGNADLYVDIVGANGLGTTGKLTSMPGTVGMVHYHSSTFGGYSGAVYHNGNSVYGMHTTGGRANMGVAAMFLLHAAKIALGMRDEAYDRAFYNKVMRERTAHQNVAFVGDYAVIENQMGYFYRFPKEDFLRFRSEDEYRDEYEDRESIASDDFFVPENVHGVALNSVRPGNTQVGNSFPRAGTSGQTEAQSRSTSELNELLAKLCQKLTAISKKRYRKRKPATSIPTQAPPPS